MLEIIWIAAILQGRGSSIIPQEINGVEHYCLLGNVDEEILDVPPDQPPLAGPRGMLVHTLS